MNSLTSRLLFLGDVVVGSQLTDTWLSGDLKRLFMRHSLVGCNFEAPVLGGGSRILKAGPHLTNHPSVAPVLRDAGVTLFNLANNHIFDYGSGGLELTLQQLEGAYIVGAGMTRTEAYSLKIVQIGEVKIGFLGYCEGQFGALVDPDEVGPGCAWVNAHQVDADIAAAKQRVNILIVQVHAGAEGVSLPLPEWRQRYRSLVDAGAQAVICHHPHVVQGWETYKGAPIFYSLGNFHLDFQATPGSGGELGLAVSLEISAEGIVSVDCHWIQCDRGMLKIAEKLEISSRLEQLNAMLAEPEYLMRANQQASELWEQRYRKLYSISLGKLPPNAGIRDWVRYLGNKVMPSRFLDRNNALLLHNLRIETHRWCVERALSNFNPN